MKAPDMTDMATATRLTREGRLVEATAVIRAALGMGRPAQSDGAPRARPDSILELTKISADAGAARSMPEREATKTKRSPQPESAPQAATALRGIMEGLGRLGAMPRGATARQAPTLLVKDGARFEARVFANEAGSRAYKLYVPGGAADKPMPLVVMLHGCTQSPDDFAAGTRMNEIAEELKILVAYPAQSQSANASKCWNWFNAADQQRDSGEPSLIAGMTRQIMRDFDVDPARVYVAGLSAGGAAAAVLGATHPDLYAAIAVHSGLACGAARDMPSAFAAMRQGAPAARAFKNGKSVPTIVFHGDRDTTVNPANASSVIAQQQPHGGLKSEIVNGVAPGGMRFTRTAQSDARGRSVLEQWDLHGAGHAWSGGSSAGSYTDPRGPDASREMMRFFLQHAKEFAPVA